MTSVRLLWLLLCLSWIVAEIVLAQKNTSRSKKPSESEERSQSVLWITVVISIVMALNFKLLGFLPIAIPYLPRQLLAIFLFAGGLYFRYCAVTTLGRYFTTNVLIQSDHELMVDGLYQWIRHPAYSGLLLAFAAVGLAMGDLLSEAALTVPVFFALNNRMSIEEKMLANKFGKKYRDYCCTTWRLIPWLY